MTTIRLGTPEYAEHPEHPSRTLRVTHTITFTVDDLRLNKRPKRYVWPWAELQPGDAIRVTAPHHFLTHVTTTANGHARKDGSVRLRAKSEKGEPTDHARRAARKALIWCEDTGERVTLPTK